MYQQQIAGNRQVGVSNVNKYPSGTVNESTPSQLDPRQDPASQYNQGNATMQPLAPQQQLQPLSQKPRLLRFRSSKTARQHNCVLPNAQVPPRESPTLLPAMSPRGSGANVPNVNNFNSGNNGDVNSGNNGNFSGNNGNFNSGNNGNFNNVNSRNPVEGKPMAMASGGPVGAGYGSCPVGEPSGARVNLSGVNTGVNPNPSGVNPNPNPSGVNPNPNPSGVNPNPSGVNPNPSGANPSGVNPSRANPSGNLSAIGNQGGSSGEVCNDQAANDAVVASEEMMNAGPVESVEAPAAKSNNNGAVTTPTHIVSVTLSQGRNFSPALTDPYVVMLVGSREETQAYLEKSTTTGSAPNMGRQAMSRTGRPGTNPSEDAMGSSYPTRPAHGSAAPVTHQDQLLAAHWDERFDFLFDQDAKGQDGGRPDSLLLQLWDKGEQDRLVGASIISLREYWASEATMDNGGFQWFEVVQEGQVRAHVHIQISCSTTENQVQVQCASYSHLLRVQVIEGKGLPSMDRLSKSDPYCEVQFSGTMFRTDVVKNNNNPVWQSATCYFWVNESDCDYRVGLTVWDQDRATSNDFMGQTFMSIRQLFDTINSSDGVDQAQADLWMDLCASPATDVQLAKALQGLQFVTTGKKTKHGAGAIHVSTELRTRGSVENEFFTQLLDAVKMGATRGSTSSSSGSTSSGEEDGPKDSLTHAQMAWVLDAIGSRADDREVNQLFDSMDTNKDGTVDRHEFLAFLHSARGQAMFDIPKLLVFLAKGASAVDSMMGAVEWESSAGSKHVLVKDLETGVVVKENIPVYVSAAIKAMTSTALGRKFTKNTDRFMRTLSQRQGRRYDDPRSVAAIQPFVALHHINLDEVEKPVDQYRTFNEFFSRRLKAGARVIDRPLDPACAVSPADCRMVVFETVKEATEFWIKGKRFTISSLLGPAAQVFGSKFEGGSIAVARLAPQDYHCWHFPVTGILGPVYSIPGSLYSVNPAVVNNPGLDVFTVNKRAIVPIYTQHFGVVAVIPIAAVMVGSMEIGGNEGAEVAKGQLHGCFKFGGSTVVILFEPGRINFERRLLANSTPRPMSKSPGPFASSPRAGSLHSNNSISIKESLVRQGQFMGQAIRR